MKTRPNKRVKRSTCSSFSPLAPSVSPRPPKSLMNTPLGTLQRIETALWLHTSTLKMRRSSTGTNTEASLQQSCGSIPLDQFHSFVKERELLDSPSTDASDKNHLKVVFDVNDSDMLRLMDNAVELTKQLVDTERYLLDLMVVAGSDPSKLGFVKDDLRTSLYTLYRFAPSESATTQIANESGIVFDLEVLKPPPKQSSRLEVMKSLYKFSRKIYFGHADPETTKWWWKHVATVARVILDSRKQTISKKSVNSANKIEISSLEPLATGLNASDLITKDMTLEERVRIRAQLREQSLLKQSVNLMARTPGSSSDEPRRKNKMLLELADALWSFANRRSLGDQSGLLVEFSKERSAKTASFDSVSSGKIAKLTVEDFIKDARISWKSVLGRGNFGGDEEGSGSRAGSSGRYRISGVTDAAKVDLSRVLFHIRMKMITTTDGSSFSSDVTSDKRRMETEMLGLLSELASTFPKWIRLLDVPSSLMATNKVGGAWEYRRFGSNGTTIKNPSSRSSIIIIRNDAVDYARYVHLPLGGKSIRSEPTKQSHGADITNIARFLSSASGKKRPHNELQQKDKKLGPSAIANTIVPPSFVRLYGKALGVSDNDAMG
ncbi:hypothetical protein ACHAXS_009561 [Conticribra weissflogii]